MVVIVDKLRIKIIGGRGCGQLANSVIDYVSLISRIVKSNERPPLSPAKRSVITSGSWPVPTFCDNHLRSEAASNGRVSLRPD